MVQPIRGIVFDVDGTLVDSKEAQARAWFDALSDSGIAVSMESVRSRQGMSTNLFLRSLCGIASSDPIAERIVTRRADLFLSRHLGAVRAIPRARRLLQRMREDHLRLLAMGPCSERELDAVLGMAGISDLVGGRVGSEDRSRTEPAADLLERAIGAIGLRAEAVTLIADTPYDIDAANRLEMPVIAIRSGGWDDRALRDAIAIYDSIGQLLRFYEASPLAKNWTREGGTWSANANGSRRDRKNRPRRLAHGLA